MSTHVAPFDLIAQTSGVNLFQPGLKFPGAFSLMALTAPDEAEPTVRLLK